MPLTPQKQVAKENDARPVVLLYFRYFNSEYLATGPTQSILRLVTALGDRFRFRVVTLALPGEADNRWSELCGVERFAVARGARGLIQQWHLIRRSDFGLAIHNSFFDPQFTIAVLLMRRLRLVEARPTVVAPRGEFNRGALSIKTRRKSLYLRAARLLGLLKDVTLQVTDEVEAAAIRLNLPAFRSIITVANIRGLEPLPSHSPRAPGDPLRVAFVSRVDPMKNLDRALLLLAKSAIPVTFDIIGPTYDQTYWRACERLMDALPEPVVARYLGVVAPGEVITQLARYDLMLLPTAGENYGHAIVDSLLAGTPVLISDRTRWTALAAARAGADLPLEDEQAWLTWIRRFQAMPQEELQGWRAGARSYVESALNCNKDAAAAADCYRKLLSPSDT